MRARTSNTQATKSHCIWPALKRTTVVDDSSLEQPADESISLWFLVTFCTCLTSFSTVPLRALALSSPDSPLTRDGIWFRRYHWSVLFSGCPYQTKHGHWGYSEVQDSERLRAISQRGYAFKKTPNLCSIPHRDEKTMHLAHGLSPTCRVIPGSSVLRAWYCWTIFLLWSSTCFKRAYQRKTVYYLHTQFNTRVFPVGKVILSIIADVDNIFVTLIRKITRE